MQNIQNEDQDDQLNSFNPMRAHYEDAELNKFVDGVAEGMNAMELKEKCTIFIRYPRGISRNGLYNLLKSFGNVSRIFVPNNIKQNYSMAFVDYNTFADAERAVRALNADSNSGLGIRAEISHGAQKSPEEIPRNPESSSNISNEHPQEVLSDISSIDFPKQTNYREKVTQFEFQHYEPREVTRQLKNLKKFADDSKWLFSKNKQLAQFNHEMRDVHNFPEFYCRRCNKVATLYDEKSQDYFCSLSCFQNLQNYQEYENIMLKKSDKVCITSIINEKLIYIRRSSDDLNHLLEEIYKTAKNLIKFEMIPTVGDEVLAKVFDGIYRAEVMEIDDNDELGIKIVIQLVDIGCTTETTLECLFEMTSECQNFIPVVHKVYIKNVEVTSINMDVIEYLTNLRDAKKELTIKSIEYENDQMLVELKDDEGNFVGQKITRLANFDQITITPTTIESLKSLPLSTGENKKLFVINKKMLTNNGVLWCLEEKFLKDFHEMQKSLNDYGKMLNRENYGANTNDMVLVKIKDQWFRACIQEKSGDGKPFCCLIDICDTCKVPVEDIFVLPTVFTHYPMYSECYEVHGYLSASEKKKKFLASYLLGNNFIIADEVKNSRNGLVLYFAALKE